MQRGCRMTRSRYLLASFLLLFASSHRIASPVRAADLFILQQPATVYSLQDGELKPLADLANRSCLRCRPNTVQILSGAGGQTLVLVDVIGNSTVRSGWVCPDYALNLSQWADCVGGRRSPQSVPPFYFPPNGGNQPPPPQPPTPPERNDLPALIAIQDEAIRTAWKELERAVEANAQLVASEQLPEPFLARAEIWGMVGNHQEALRDNLRAAEILHKRGVDLVDFAKYFVVLKDALDKYDREPVPRFLAEALDYWALGTTDFFRSRYAEALPRFVNAVQLDPGNPLYWYYRSLTYLGLSQEREAVHDAKVGAALERRLRESLDIETLRNLGSRLERIQGPRRTWLEGFRQGDPSSWRSTPSSQDQQVSQAGSSAS